MQSCKQIQQLVLDEFSSDKIQKTYEEMTRMGLWKSEEKLFRKYFKKGTKILDIGCGSGRTTFPLSRMGYNVIGIDITPAMISTAKRIAKEFKLNIDFEVGDATKLGFKNESFDNALFSYNGWEQIPGEKNRSKALKEAYRVIKPGGYYIFSSHTRVLKGYFLFWLKQWIRFYILKPLGFKIKEMNFGDRFFKSSSIEEYRKEQFVHIPRLSRIKAQIKEAGFKLILFDKRNNIAKEDEKLKTGNCTIFVCKKPV